MKKRDEILSILFIVILLFCLIKPVIAASNTAQASISLSIEEVAEEEEEEEEGPPSGAGRAAPGAVGGIGWITIIPDPFKNEIRQGQTKTVKLNITNNILTNLDISIDYSEFERFMLIEDSDFVLKVRDSKLLDVELFANYDELPEVYIGKIKIYANRILNELDTVLEVKERRSLFKS